MTAWLSARFGRARGDDGLGRVPPMTDRGCEDDFFAELIAVAPDQLVALIAAAADFLRIIRTARAPAAELDRAVLRDLSQEICDFADWYAGCGLAEPATAECITDLARLREMLDDALSAPITGRVIVHLLCHIRPNCCHRSEPHDEGFILVWSRDSRKRRPSKARPGRFARTAPSFARSWSRLEIAPVFGYRAAAIRTPKSWRPCSAKSRMAAGGISDYRGAQQWAHAMTR
jgi:hypothetical protein